MTNKVKTFEKPYIEATQYSLYHLSDADMKWCEDRANQRHYGSRMLGLKEKSYDMRRGGLWNNIKGVIGEYVFCILYGLDPDIHVRVASTPDQGSDVTAWGKRHGVK